MLRDLHEMPARQLAEAGPNQAASYLAWPLVRSGDTARIFADFWSDATWLRTATRFAKFEAAAEAARPCVALLRVGLRMLEFSAVGDTGCHELASMLTDAIDEVRYTFPEIGLSEWSSLAGSLAGIMASRGLLKGVAVDKLLARYHGDDAALAAAMVNMAANGVPAVDIRSALASLGDDSGHLIRRWEAWNARYARDKQGKPSAFLVSLMEISAA